MARGRVVSIPASHKEVPVPNLVSETSYPDLGFSWGEGGTWIRGENSEELKLFLVLY